MTRFVALLRGVNVGGHRKVSMSELREHCRELGFEDVASYIQSGNLVLRAQGGAKDVAGQIERAVDARFGFAVDVLARTTGQWSAHVAANPFPEASQEEPNRVILLLSKKPPATHALDTLRRLAKAGERLEATRGAIWIHYAGGMGRSGLAGAPIDRAIGSPVTARNWNTVLALDAMVHGILVRPAAEG